MLADRQTYTSTLITSLLRFCTGGEVIKEVKKIAQEPMHVTLSAIVSSYAGKDFFSQNDENPREIEKPKNKPQLTDDARDPAPTNEEARLADDVAEA